MYRPRIIPVLLLRNLGLVKSVHFKDHRYIGDPINAVKIFNDLKADELVFLDITASAEKRLISLDFVKNVGDEANMPFSVGGGIRTIQDIRKVLHAGAEKVVINSAACEDPGFIREASEVFGSSTITVCLDVRKKLFGGYKVYMNTGRNDTGMNPVVLAKKMEEMGAGEIILQSIDQDGSMEGYDIDLIHEVSENVRIPVVALGGAGTIEHFLEAVSQGKASAVAAGSMFVYHGPRRAVLVNFPSPEEIKQLIS